MQAIRARLAAVVASFILAALSSMGLREVTPEAGAQVEAWVGHTFELMLFLGYAVLHPWLEGRTKRAEP